VAELLPNATVIIAPDVAAFYRNFIDRICNVLAGDQFEIAAKTVKSNGYFGDYEVGMNTYSKEPLALVTRNDDPMFSDFVNYVLMALMAAEEQNYSQDTASSFVTSTIFGEEYKSMFQNAVREVGNYAEIYARHLEPIVPRRDVNKINDGSTGLIFSHPFGSVERRGPGPIPGGTLEEIRNRGFLRCGITPDLAIFAIFDAETQTHSGLDIDYCRAVSAAIFNGITNTVVYVVLTSGERFIKLARGEVDMLSRLTTVTLDRDVSEPTTCVDKCVGFSFSQPDFYDGVSFGGIPP
jgi:hypothetical protein